MSKLETIQLTNFGSLRHITLQLDRSSFSITMVENVSQWDRECQLTTRNVHSLKVNESVLHSYKLQMKNLIRHSSNLSLSHTQIQYCRAWCLFMYECARWKECEKERRRENVSKQQEIQLNGPLESKAQNCLQRDTSNEFKMASIRAYLSTKESKR